MKKAITIICLVLSAVIILDSFNAWQALAMFYLAGEIPGTHASISAGTMMSVFALLIGFVLARIGNKAILSLFDRVSFKRPSQHA
jgi:predicted membrane metal-binding protein